MNSPEQTHGEVQLKLIFGAKEPPPLLTPPPMPRVERVVLVLSLPMALLTHFCSLTHPLSAPPQESGQSSEIKMFMGTLDALNCPERATRNLSAFFSY